MEAREQHPDERELFSHLVEANEKAIQEGVEFVKREYGEALAPCVAQTPRGANQLLPEA